MANIANKGEFPQQNLVLISGNDLENLIEKAVMKGLENHQKPDAPEKLLSIPQVCELFRVSKATVHNWKRAGKLPFKRIQRRVYFLESEVLKALQGGAI